MPIVVNRKNNALEVKGSCEWSWPDHPREMSDAEARIRVERASPRPGPETTHRRIDEAGLAIAYGKLLESGEARIQQTTERGDTLTRNVGGHLVGIKQEIATDVAETRNNWPAEVYDTRREVVKYPGLTPPNAWGEPNLASLSTWVPFSDRQQDKNQAIVAARALAGANTSRAADDVAWCVNLNLDDDGDIWHEAVSRGRAVEGNADDLRECAERSPRELEIAKEANRTDYEAEAYGPNWIVLHIPDRGGDNVAQARDELYATARGSLCTEFGPPLSGDEKALDALAASLIASRGTNGAGLGWDPPEPELLREAGRELQRSPERLQDLVSRVGTIEHQLYPPWPGRELLLEPDKEPERERDSGEPLDRERVRHHLDIERWRQEQERSRGHRRPPDERDRDKERDPHRPPIGDPPPHPDEPWRLPSETPDPRRAPDKEPDPMELPGADPDPGTPDRPADPYPHYEPPPPERAPTPNRDLPREREHGRTPSR